MTARYVVRACVFLGLMITSMEFCYAQDTNIEIQWDSKKGELLISGNLGDLTPTQLRYLIIQAQVLLSGHSIGRIDQMSDLDLASALAILITRTGVLPDGVTAPSPTDPGTGLGHLDRGMLIAAILQVLRRAGIIPSDAELDRIVSEIRNDGDQATTFFEFNIEPAEGSPPSLRVTIRSIQIVDPSSGQRPHESGHSLILNGFLSLLLEQEGLGLISAINQFAPRGEQISAGDVENLLEAWIRRIRQIIDDRFDDLERGAEVGGGTFDDDAANARKMARAGAIFVIQAMRVCLDDHVRQRGGRAPDMETLKRIVTDCLEQVEAAFRRFMASITLQNLQGVSAAMEAGPTLNDIRRWFR